MIQPSRATTRLTIPFLVALGSLSCSGSSPPGPALSGVGPAGTAEAPRTAAVNFADLAKAVRPMRPGGDDQRHEFPAPLPIPRARCPARHRALPEGARRGRPAQGLPAPLDSFGGVFGDYSTADTHGAVGPNHLVTAVNRAIVVQDRSGLRLYPSVPLDSFWNPILGPDRHDAFDPRVLRDHFKHRWIIVAAYRRRQPDTSAVFIAASDGPTRGRVEDVRGAVGKGGLARLPQRWA